MFTEYALNALLKQTYARTMVDCALFAMPLTTSAPAHPYPSGEYISRPGTDVNSLSLTPSRNLAFGWQGRAKVKERKWLPHMEAILYARVYV